MLKNYSDDKTKLDGMIPVRQLLPFWDDLTADEKELVLNNAITAHYEPGQLLFGSDGALCLGLVAVRSGSVRVSMISEEGREILLYRIGAGEICVLSASCVLKQITFEVHMEAEVDTDVVILGSGALNILMESNIKVENFVYKLTAERFSDVMWAMQQLLFYGFDRRLATYLYNALAEYPDGRIKTTHEQIAKNIGSAREVVTRMLNRFADEGIVELQRGVIIVKDKEALKALAD